MAIEGIWAAMNHSLRNAGVPGAGSMAVAAVDIALWDLKAKLLGRSLVDLFGSVRAAVPIYGSGGFTSYTEKRLTEQLGGWAAQGIGRVKMKVGRDAAADLRRVRVAREAIGPNVELFVDANGAYTRKQALAMAQRFAEDFQVTWFEEPRPSNDLEGLRLLRDRGPAGMDIAAGEYGDTAGYFRNMLQAGAVDCLQADATRCGGYTGFFKVAALCDAFQMPLSAHCAPQLHAHIGCAVSCLRHVEYFHDHNRIDRMLFDGAIEPRDGALSSRPRPPGARHGVQARRCRALSRSDVLHRLLARMRHEALHHAFDGLLDDSGFVRIAAENRLGEMLRLLERDMRRDRSACRDRKWLRRPRADRWTAHDPTRRRVAPAARRECRAGRSIRRKRHRENRAIPGWRESGCRPS